MLILLVIFFLGAKFAKTPSGSAVKDWIIFKRVESICNDLQDNDGDGLFDCDDLDCSRSKSCNR